MYHFIFCLLALTFIGCVSSEEQKERRDDAFNLEGDYNPKFQNDLEVEFKIMNDGHRSKIKAQVLRSSELTEAETKILVEKHISKDKVHDFFVNKLLIFASGESSNVSLDNGSTSSFNACSPSITQAVNFTDDKEKHTTWQSATIRYCLSGTARKSDGMISGKLSLQISLKGVGPAAEDGKRETKYSHFGSPSFEYTTELVGGFSSQYNGQWDGQVYNTTEPALNQIVGLHFTLDETQTQLNPSVLFRVVHIDGSQTESLKTVPFRGADFSLEDTPILTAELERSKFPQILFSFRSPSGARLIFSGTIWSLGAYKGTIVYVENDQESLLGSFEFIKH